MEIHALAFLEKAVMAQLGRKQDVGEGPEPAVWH